MDLEFLGTGNCAGVPVYGCECEICSEARVNPKLRRLSTCSKIATIEQTILIDAGIAELGDRFPRSSIDRIILSHYHIDHVYGLFPMRWGHCEHQLPVHGPDDKNGCDDLLKHHGILDFSDTLAPFVRRKFADIEITPLPLNHSKLTLGYAISSDNGCRLAWLADTSGLPDLSADFLKEWQPHVMVIDCSFPPLDCPHPNHKDIRTAIEIHEKIHPGKTYFTHIDHELDQWLKLHGNDLPETITIARDNLTIKIG